VAFVKTSFIPPGKSAKARARAALQYEGTRPGKNGEEIIRTLFGHDGPLTEEQAEQMIEEAVKNTYFWSLIVSPDPNGAENANRLLSLRKLSKDLVRFLELRLKRPIEFIAAEHNDHTDIPHVHALLLIERYGREMLITEKTLADLRQLAAGKALEQQEALSKTLPLIASQDRHQVQQPQDRAQLVQAVPAQPRIGSAGGRASSRVTRPVQACYECGKTWDRYHECEEELELTLKPK
jgi:hypothetical protein